MKKIICFFLPAVILFLSACGQKKNELVELESNITYGNRPDIIFKTEKDVYSQEDTVITCTLIYTGSEEYSVAFYPMLFLHKLENNEWKQVEYKKGEFFFPELAQVLTPKSPKRSTEFALDEFYYTPLGKGTYRISDGIFITNTFKIE